MIKKYLDFIQESFSSDLHGTIGEYISDIAKGDEYIQMIIGDYTKEIDASVDLSNAINVLDDLDKVELLKRVENYLNGVEGEVDVTTSTNIDLLEESYGKGVLSTFFKCLTALGFKDNSPQNSEIPAEFLIFFKFIGVESSKIESVFQRFKSLSSIEIDYSHPSMGLYFGIRSTGDFEYGYYYTDLVPIGNFKLNKSSLNSLKLSEFKSASGIKKVLLNLSLSDILLFGKIKNEMNKFNPGHVEQKSTPFIDDRTIIFGYYGVGGWVNGKIDESDFINIKSNLKSFLSKYKWSEKIQISITPNKFWIYIKIKLK